MSKMIRYTRSWLLPLLFTCLLSAVGARRAWVNGCFCFFLGYIAIGCFTIVFLVVSSSIICWWVYFLYFARSRCEIQKTNTSIQFLPLSIIKRQQIIIWQWIISLGVWTWGSFLDCCLSLSWSCITLRPQMTTRCEENRRMAHITSINGST